MTPPRREPVCSSRRDRSTSTGRCRGDGGPASGLARVRGLAVGVVVCSVLAVPLVGAGQGGSEEAVVVGSKKFTEGVILGELGTLVIRDAGREAVHRPQLGGTQILWNALRRGEIDAYPEYTGTIGQEILAGEDLRSEAEIRRAVEERGVRMTEALGFDNTYALGMRKELARRLGISEISDLHDHPELEFGFTNEFLDREDGWPSLRRRYDLPGANVRGLDHDLAYRAVANGSVDVVDLYSTDPEISYYDLAVLEDDRSHFPEYEAVYLYRADLQGRAPEAVAALERLEHRVDAGEMIEMNARAKLDRVPESTVAAEFLAEEFGVHQEVRAPTRLDRVWTRTLEHLYLVGISMLGAIVVALPLGIAAARHPRLGQAVLGAVGIIQTIPALALLVFMIPLLGIGGPPAIAALFLYSLLPIVRNTHAGLTDIPAGIRESAMALGLPSPARLRLVEMPLAGRSILAGIKTSAVINIGTATLGALIGAGGYGQPILTGIRLDDVGLILEGAVPAALLAIGMQGLFELFERWVIPAGLRLQPEGSR